MKIAVNCWVLRNKQIDGIGRFTIETIRIMISSHPEIEFLILCDKNFTEDYFDFSNAKKYHIFPALRHPVLYVLYMEVVVSRFLAKHKPDLLISTDGMISLTSSYKQMTVIHDLNFEHYPSDLKLRNRIFYRSFFKKYAKKATRIVTISSYSKKDIVELYKVDPGKIDIIPLGIMSVFSPISGEEINFVKNKYTSGADYFFFVGSMHPRKNIARLMLAFEAFKKQTNSIMKLVLVGHIMWDEKSIKDVLDSLQFKNDIIFTGRVSDDELKLISGAAYCLTFVPAFEGFGLPVVEAFAMNVPVICSNITSLPEVAEDAAIQVNPFNIEEITAAMVTISENKELRQELIQRGAIRKQLFTWQKTADLLYKSMIKAIQE